jgi:hypothetical protein
LFGHFTLNHWTSLVYGSIKEAPELAECLGARNISKTPNAGMPARTKFGIPEAINLASETKADLFVYMERGATQPVAPGD